MINPWRRVQNLIEDCERKNISPETAYLRVLAFVQSVQEVNLMIDTELVCEDDDFTVGMLEVSGVFVEGTDYLGAVRDAAIELAYPTFADAYVYVWKEDDQGDPQLLARYKTHVGEGMSFQYEELL